jgi:hypothetical protein
MKMDALPKVLEAVTLLPYYCDDGHLTIYQFLEKV